MEKARGKYGFSQAYKKAKRKSKANTLHNTKQKKENKKEQAMTITIDSEPKDSDSIPVSGE